MGVVELSFLLEAVTQQQVVLEPQRRVVKLTDIFGLGLPHALLLDDSRKDFPLKLGKWILMLKPDLFGIDEDLAPDAKKAIYCVSLVILTLVVLAALGLVV